MEISIKKYRDKPSILSITRSDGSSTWSKLHPNTEYHDLGHFAVESVLGFKHAFFGIINQGYSIQDFEAPRDHRPEAVEAKNLHHEALITEHLVNLIQIDLLRRNENLNILEELSLILDNHHLPFPEGLNEVSLNNIRELFLSLVEEWKNLEPEQSLIRTLGI